jgi:hypothetical protein
MAARSEDNGSAKTRKRRARQTGSSEALRKRGTAAGGGKQSNAATGDDDDAGEACGFDVAEFLDTRSVETDDGAGASVTLPAGGVQIRITRDEITISIDPAALRRAFAPSEQETAAEPQPATVADVSGKRLPPPPGVARGLEPSRAPAAPVFVGLVTVPADKVGDGYNNFQMRTDLRDHYMPVLQQAKALGGIITSSGGIRSLREKATPGRSKTSLHYTGRAIDLYIYSGMQGATDRYMIVPDGGTPDHPLWQVLCVSTDPRPGDPAYDESLLKEGEVEYVVWRKNVGFIKAKRTARYFSLTDLFRKHGWNRIPARSDWKTNYLSCEWWHFQHHLGLVSGQSRFGPELMGAWPADLVNKSGLALDATWTNLSFRA